MRYLRIGLLVACHSGAADSVDAPIDSADGTGCTTTTPRAQAPEAFVGPTGLQDRLGTLIDSAQTSLDLQMYLFTVRALADKVVAAKNRGVAVRVILDPDEAGNQNVIPTFTSGGVTWKNASTVYQFSHAKYLVIDRTTASRRPTRSSAVRHQPVLPARQADHLRRDRVRRIAEPVVDRALGES